MAAVDKQDQGERETARPRSGTAPASLSGCLGRLLATASATEPGASLTESIEPLLEVLADLEPGACAAVHLQSAEEARRPDVWVVVTPPGGAARASATQVAEIGRAFPQLADERVVSLGSVRAGTLHFAAPEWRHATAEAYDLMLHQVACVIDLVIRLAQTEEHLQAAENKVVQLEKLATMGRTAAGIVHEINNPLTAIIAYSEFLMRKLASSADSSTDADRLRRIGEAASRAQMFCRELTDYSRPSGRLRAPVDLHDIIDRALSFCAHGLKEGDITVERIYRDVPMVAGMDTQLTQVFVNLFGNAADAMHDSGGTLAIRTSHRAGRVLIEVADEGHGIAAEHLPLIFDSYFTTKPRGAGVGLGLSIVRQVIADHGGSLRAENRKPRGTVFYIELPIVMEP